LATTWSDPGGAVNAPSDDLELIGQLLAASRASGSGATHNNVLATIVNRIELSPMRRPPAVVSRARWNRPTNRDTEHRRSADPQPSQSKRRGA
jgi:hypothetical protein